MEKAVVDAPHLAEILPLAEKWATEEEQRILRDGVALSESEIADARALGVQQPEKIRLLRVNEVPSPPHPALRTAQTAIRALCPATSGLTLRYGIFIRSDCWGDRSLVVHELVHTSQYERLGGILPFLKKYLWECFTLGYAQAPMELEAVSKQERICAT